MRSDIKVKEERTGWRDSWLSDRHRKWGHDCPAIDIDFMMTEFCFKEPRALIDYKHAHLIGNVAGNSLLVDIDKAGFVAMKKLADKSQIPAMIVYYWPDTACFCVRSLNDYAREFFNDGELMSEKEYVAALYRVRRLVPERKDFENTFKDLSIYKPGNKGYK